jgi:transposase
MKKKNPREKFSSGLARSVSMQTLDKELSRHVEVARTEPVPVERYGVPWVWIVSHPLWVEVDRLQSFVPDDHALVALREAIDSTLAYEGTVLNELTRECTSGVDARVIMRAWLLQIVYSLADPKRVREGLGYNMLWRWFVGFLLRSEPLPEARAFIHDIRMVSAHPQAIDIVHRCLTHGALADVDTEEFSINYGLLHTLRAHHHLEARRMEVPDPVLRTRREHGGQAVAG